MGNSCTELFSVDTKNETIQVSYSGEKNDTIIGKLTLDKNLKKDHDYFADIKNPQVKKTWDMLSEFNYQDKKVNVLFKPAIQNSSMMVDNITGVNQNQEKLRVVKQNIDSSTFLGVFIFLDEISMKTYDQSHVLDFNIGKASGRRIWHDDYTQYEGHFMNGLFNGSGRMIYHNGDYYEGLFVNGHQCGEGKYVSFDEGIAYSGKFKDNQYNGMGKLIDNRSEESFIYRGNFVKGQMEGNKATYETDSYKYTGNFRNGLFHDENGCLEYKDRELNLQGKFHEGEYQDKTTSFIKKSQNSKSQLLSSANVNTKILSMIPEDRYDDTDRDNSYISQASKKPKNELERFLLG